MALLMVLTWSFHHTYQQTPSVCLKAPTLLYMFIFIALRALRAAGGVVDKFMGDGVMAIFSAVEPNKSYAADALRAVEAAAASNDLIFAAAVTTASSTWR